MKISQLILYLNSLRKKHGDIEVIGYAPHYAEDYPINDKTVTFVQHETVFGGKPAIQIGPE